MIGKESNDVIGTRRGRKSQDDYRRLDHAILEQAFQGAPRIDFLREALALISDFSGCGTAELWFRENQQFYRCFSIRSPEAIFRYEVVRSSQDLSGAGNPISENDSISDALRHDILSGKKNARLKDHYIGDVLYFDDLDRISALPTSSGKIGKGNRPEGSSGKDTLALFPLIFYDETMGVLQLSGPKKTFILKEEIESYVELFQTLGIALMIQRAQAALRERVKELTCLYSIARVAEREGISLDGILKGIAELLPPAWQYPDITGGRIVLDDKIYATSGFRDAGQKQLSKIVVGGEARGVIEIVYAEQKPDLDEGPFLREERSLIDAIAREIAIIVERKETEEEKAKLQEQLRHADRLATIGQLAAGVAHELNEPLGSMLGFAQLAKKQPGLPKQAEKDISKIETASLHAREIVKKLMLFGRQSPPQKTNVDINKMIEEGLYFIKSRCKKNGIEIKLSLSPDLPEIVADQSQIYQVLVNLVVNAVQAMPDGGQLTISTQSHGNNISMNIEDTGIGMDEEIQKKIFLPFFTTKEVNEGTGIGLSVVHGIVISHGGKINVESAPGRGTRFEISLPVKSLGNDSGKGQYESG